MHQILVLLLALACVNAKSLRDAAESDEGAAKVISKRADPYTCTSLFKDFQTAYRIKVAKPKWYHSACTPHSPYLWSGPQYISETDKALILERHNFYRGHFTPSPWDERTLHWSDELQNIAQGWANKLKIKHERADKRQVPGKFPWVGQNLAANSINWDKAIWAWYKEYAEFEYGVGRKPNVDPLAPVGHFTQLMWNATYLIGCGYAEHSSGAPKLYICDYAPGGNIESRINNPFTFGERAHMCQAEFRASGQCDCSATVCDPNNSVSEAPNARCVCDCKGGFTGPECKYPAEE